MIVSGALLGDLPGKGGVGVDLEVGEYPNEEAPINLL